MLKHALTSREKEKRIQRGVRARADISILICSGSISSSSSCHAVCGCGMRKPQQPRVELAGAVAGRHLHCAVGQWVWAWVVRTGSGDAASLLVPAGGSGASHVTSEASEVGTSLVSRTGVTVMGVVVGGMVETTTRAWVVVVAMLRLTGRSVASECGGEGDLLGGLSSMVWPR